MADKNGVTKREHLEQIEKATGETPRDLDPPDVPDCFDDILEVYWELRSGEALTYTEIDAFARLTDTEVGVDDVSMLRQIDSIVSTAITKKQREKSGSSNTDN